MGSETILGGYWDREKENLKPCGFVGPEIINYRYVSMDAKFANTDIYN